MKLAAKDSQKVRDLHNQIMAIADKYDMDMEELVDAAVEGEAPEMEGEEEPSMEEMPGMAEDEEEDKPMDKAKIALIVGKMRRGAE